MKKKIFIIMFVLVMITSLATAQEYKRSVIEESKYSISGTVKNDYNEGIFTMDEGITGVFELIIEDATPYNYSILFISDEGKEYECLSYELSNDNDTVYDKCTVYVNETGNYIGSVKIDDEYIYVERLKVVDAKLDTFSIILIISAILTGILGFFYISVLLIPFTLFSVSALVSVLFRYKYAIGDDIFVGLVGFILLGLIILIMMIIKKLIE